MQAEAVGRHLRVMGDAYNRLLLQRVSDHIKCACVSVIVQEMTEKTSRLISATLNQKAALEQLIGRTSRLPSVSLLFYSCQKKKKSTKTS